MTDKIRTHFEEAASVLQKFMADSHNYQLITDAAGIMATSVKGGGKILSCGNGGSMADAMHFAEELTGRFRGDRKPIAAISIADPTHISCTANDYGYEQIFSRYVEALGKPGDVLLAISTSGNSVNVLKAAEVAKANGMKIVALTGKDGGKLAAMADVEIRAPHSQYADRVQEIHIKIIHSLIDSIEGLV
jgi:D-sedoheptulose 7-phosphate isomerase